jgi:AraC-like DNA-binding protein
MSQIQDPQFEASSLFGLRDLVTELGGDPDAVARSCQYDLTTLADPDKSLDYHTYSQLLEAAAVATACPHFGLLLGQRADLSILGTLGILTRNCSTFGDAYQTFIRYYNIVSLGEIFRLERGPVTSTLIREPTIPDLALSVQVQDVTLSEALSTTRQLCGSRWKPTGIYLTHSPPDLTIYQAVFGCPVHPEQNLQAMSFTTADLDLPLNKSNEFRHELETQVAELSRQRAKSFKQIIRDAIKLGLATGNCSVRQVADSLAMHTRTVHRKLLKEGTTFTALLEDTRRQLAHHLLAQTRLSIFEISQLLGYSDATAFSRSCRRWFGASPSTWRERH